jgi:hypothetical protein
LRLTLGRKTLPEKQLQLKGVGCGLCSKVLALQEALSSSLRTTSKRAFLGPFGECGEGEACPGELELSFMLPLLE